MKKNKILVVGLITIAISSGYFINGMASTLKPGTSQDPLVSKSYVDDEINKLKASLATNTATEPTVTSETYVVSKLSDEDMNEIVSDVIAQVEYLYKNTVPEKVTTVVEKADPVSLFTPVQLKSGQKIIGEEGTEVILRTGKAKAYSKVEDGLVNITTGVDLKNGQEVKFNHLVIIPREDGRGLLASADCWLMVKGEFQITK